MKVGPKFKICRRLGDRVFGKCQTTKFTVSGTEKKKKSSKRPRSAPSEYALQLVEKQKAKYTYGVTEKQFSKYIDSVRHQHGGNRIPVLYKSLESRLDNVVFRLGIAPTRISARQLVSHGHILVNGRKVRVPSCTVKAGDQIKIRPESKNNGAIQKFAEKKQDYNVPEWLSFDEGKGEGLIKGEPIMGKSESNIDFESILEFYSR